MNTLGQAGEAQARQYLQHQGYHLIAQNFSCKYGEIDLIVSKGRLLVFVEVKQRAGTAFGGALGAVTKAKQNKIALTAAEFIKENGLKFDSIRFDVICITGGELTHLQNAFFPPRMTV